jgi:hypothetical protein
MATCLAIHQPFAKVFFGSIPGFADLFIFIPPCYCLNPHVSGFKPDLLLLNSWSIPRSESCYPQRFGLIFFMLNLPMVGFFSCFFSCWIPSFKDQICWVKSLHLSRPGDLPREQLGALPGALSSCGSQGGILAPWLPIFESFIGNMIEHDRIW